MNYKIIKIISEWKKRPKVKYPIPAGYTRVEAIVEIGGARLTKHIDIKDK